jgi:hypothetical protein
VYPQRHSIDRVVELAPSFGLLLAILGCVIALTVMADRSLPQLPVLGAGAQILSEPSTRTRSSTVTYPAETWTAPSRRSLAVEIRDNRRSHDGLSSLPSATVAPEGLDRSFDLRADLMDMAIAIRWHRGPASELPPGSN